MTERNCCRIEAGYTFCEAKNLEDCKYSQHFADTPCAYLADLTFCTCAEAIIEADSAGRGKQ